MTAAIETRGLGRDYGPVRAVIDLDLVVEPGQVFAFLGPNGAGKTTTIRMLLALQGPASGSAKVLGFDSGRDYVEIHRRTGYLPGELALYPGMTGHQHIAWYAKARGLRDLSLAGELAERFSAVLDRPARELSKGNKQKVGLILAFMGRPDLLILDEPTSGLDPLMRSEFTRLAREVTAEGRTVFWSSHELDEVQRLAGRVAIIKQGRLITTETVEHLRASTPHTVHARFARPADPTLFAGIGGVSVTSCSGGTIELQVTGAIGPVLKAIADCDPVDFTAQHAGLDELFLAYYREPAGPEPSHAP
ncbi:MAG TPA: ABC transporter ATP-binding protein [Streptosporangiaceae bacterium]|nr:ABC transporter ATP-binding protein [Streptosporangiaceae bacterium]